MNTKAWLITAPVMLPQSTLPQVEYVPHKDHIPTGLVDQYGDMILRVERKRPVGFPITKEHGKTDT